MNATRDYYKLYLHSSSSPDDNQQECNRSNEELSEANNIAVFDGVAKDVARNYDNDAYYCIATKSVELQAETAALLDPGFVLLDSGSSYDRSLLTMATGNGNVVEVSNVYLDLTERGLGISIRGGIDSPDTHNNTDIFISRILPNGAVYYDGRLQIGNTNFNPIHLLMILLFLFIPADVLLEVNGISLKNVMHHQAVQIIKSCEPYVHFKISRTTMASDSSEIYEQISEFKENAPLIQGQRREAMVDFVKSASSGTPIRVILKRDEVGFGFSLKGGIDNPVSAGDTKIYVSNIVQNGPAHRSGMLEVGDEIVAINDINLQKVKNAWAVNLIRTSPQTSVFAIKKQVEWD